MKFKIEPAHRCSHLDKKGKQCASKITKKFNYHGDNELTAFTERSSWVRVYFCEKHFKCWR
jgi:hypothetical protein